MEPTSWFTQALVSVEVLVGLVWTAVVIAVVIAALALEFERIAREQAGMAGRSSEDQMRDTLQDLRVELERLRELRKELERARTPRWRRLLSRLLKSGQS